jgi:hypothetical protein
MSPRPTHTSDAAALSKREPREPRESAIDRYLDGLRAQYGACARPADEARRIIDESLGATTLTGLLYMSREGGRA